MKTKTIYLLWCLTGDDYVIKAYENQNEAEKYMLQLKKAVHYDDGIDYCVGTCNLVCKN